MSAKDRRIAARFLVCTSLVTGLVMSACTPGENTKTASVAEPAPNILSPERKKEGQPPQKLNDKGGADSLPVIPAVVMGIPSGPQGDSSESIMKLPNWSGRWTTRGPFRYGSRGPAKLPMMPEYQKKLDELRAKQIKGEELDSTTARCMPNGMPMIMTSTQGLLEILFTPGRVTIISDNGEVRRIFTDGRKQLPDPDPTFEGYSVGHWEGDILYVDTAGMDPRNQVFYGFVGGGHMHVLEKMRLTDTDILTVDTTIEDPTTFTSPLSYPTNYYRDKTDPHEAMCIQNNRDVGADGTVDFSLEPPTGPGGLQWKPPGVQ